MPKEPRRSNNQRPLHIPTIGRRQPPIMQEHITKERPTHQNNPAGLNAPTWGGVGHLGNTQAQVHSTITAPTHQHEKTGMNYASRGGVGNPTNHQENSTKIVPNHENNIGLNVPSMGVVIFPHTLQGHGANVVSNPRTTQQPYWSTYFIKPDASYASHLILIVDAPIVGSANRAIHMTRENPAAEIPAHIVNEIVSSG
ncbi:hypothetical protein ZWY2020_003366 [Hordeum vulgare]|nr:hypothetical protein ZWY2020_003366 [Hordeum vulgare]